LIQQEQIECDCSLCNKLVSRSHQHIEPMFGTVLSDAFIFWHYWSQQICTPVWKPHSAVITSWLCYVRHS